MFADSLLTLPKLLGVSGLLILLVFSGVCRLSPLFVLSRVCGLFTTCPVLLLWPQSDAVSLYQDASGIGSKTIRV